MAVIARPGRWFSVACLAFTAISLSALQTHAQLVTTRVVNGLNSPIFVTHAPGRPESLFIAERNGTIRIHDLSTGQTNAAPFLSIPDVSTAGEGGLLGLAFHPDYDTNGRFYVNLTTAAGGFSTRVREYTVSQINPNLANPTPTQVLSFAQPQSNHNGGWIGFSPTDANNLYVMTGDGGSGNDSGNGHTAGTGNAQDITNNLLGKVLRIDVDGDDFAADPARNYAVPADNPFVGLTGDDEIWAYGLRNPFRASFDRVTGDLYIGDVGQGAREEIDFQPANSTGGENYGWRLREGDIATPTIGIGGPPPTGNVDPIYDYTRGFGALQGNSITGGILYRGPVAQLRGQYIFADFISNNIWTLDPADPDNTVTRINDDLLPNVGSISNIVAFGEDSVGNLYIVDIGGEVFRVGLQTGVAIPGDLNGDGFVGIEDLNTVLGVWNLNVTAGDPMAGDPSGDGFVGIEDLNVVLSGWNNGTPSANHTINATIPEPTTVMLFTGIFSALTSRRS